MLVSMCVGLSPILLRHHGDDRKIISGGNQLKKAYIEPAVTASVIEAEDVITASICAAKGADIAVYNPVYWEDELTPRD